jgi:hypothetical protein
MSQDCSPACYSNARVATTYKDSHCRDLEVKVPETSLETRSSKVKLCEASCGLRHPPPCPTVFHISHHDKCRRLSAVAVDTSPCMILHTPFEQPLSAPLEGRAVQDSAPSQFAQHSLWTHSLQGLKSQAFRNNRNYSMPPQPRTIMTDTTTYIQETQCQCSGSTLGNSCDASCREALRLPSGMHGAMPGASHPQHIHVSSDTCLLGTRRPFLRQQPVDSLFAQPCPQEPSHGRAACGVDNRWQMRKGRAHTALHACECRRDSCGVSAVPSAVPPTVCAQSQCHQSMRRGLQAGLMGNANADDGRGGIRVAAGKTSRKSEMLQTLPATLQSHNRLSGNAEGQQAAHVQQQLNACPIEDNRLQMQNVPKRKEEREDNRLQMQNVPKRKEEREDNRLQMQNVPKRKEEREDFRLQMQNVPKRKEEREACPHLEEQCRSSGRKTWPHTAGIRRTADPARKRMYMLATIQRNLPRTACSRPQELCRCDVAAAYAMQDIRLQSVVANAPLGHEAPGAQQCVLENGRFSGIRTRNVLTCVHPVLLRDGACGSTMRIPYQMTTTNQLPSESGRICHGAYAGSLGSTTLECSPDGQASNSCALPSMSPEKKLRKSSHDVPVPGSAAVDPPSPAMAADESASPFTRRLSRSQQARMLQSSRFAETSVSCRMHGCNTSVSLQCALGAKGLTQDSHQPRERPSPLPASINQPDALVSCMHTPVDAALGLQPHRVQSTSRSGLCANELNAARHTDWNKQAALDSDVALDHMDCTCMGMGAIACQRLPAEEVLDRQAWDCRDEAETIDRVTSGNMSPVSSTASHNGEKRFRVCCELQLESGCTISSAATLQRHERSMDAILAKCSRSQDIEVESPARVCSISASRKSLHESFVGNAGRPDKADKAECEPWEASEDVKDSGNASPEIGDFGGTRRVIVQASPTSFSSHVSHGMNPGRVAFLRCNRVEEAHADFSDMSGCPRPEEAAACTAGLCSQKADNSGEGVKPSEYASCTYKLPGDTETIEAAVMPERSVNTAGAPGTCDNRANACIESALHKTPIINSSSSSRESVTRFRDASLCRPSMSSSTDNGTHCDSFPVDASTSSSSSSIPADSRGHLHLGQEAGERNAPARRRGYRELRTRGPLLQMSEFQRAGHADTGRDPQCDRRSTQVNAERSDTEIPCIPFPSEEQRRPAGADKEPCPGTEGCCHEVSTGSWFMVAGSEVNSLEGYGSLCGSTEQSPQNSLACYGSLCGSDGAHEAIHHQRSCLDSEQAASVSSSSAAISSTTGRAHSRSQLFTPSSCGPCSTAAAPWRDLSSASSHCESRGDECVIERGVRRSSGCSGGHRDCSGGVFGVEGGRCGGSCTRGMGGADGMGGGQRERRRAPLWALSGRHAEDELQTRSRSGRFPGQDPPMVSSSERGSQGATRSLVSTASSPEAHRSCQEPSVSTPLYNFLLRSTRLLLPAHLRTPDNPPSHDLRSPNATGQQLRRRWAPPAVSPELPKVPPAAAGTFLGHLVGSPEEVVGCASSCLHLEDEDFLITALAGLPGVSVDAAVVHTVVDALLGRATCCRMHELWHPELPTGVGPCEMVRPYADGGRCCYGS